MTLDQFSTKATVLDTHWASENASGSPDRFELRISGGAVRVSLDSYAAKAAQPDVVPAADEAPPATTSALDILLDGV